MNGTPGRPRRSRTSSPTTVRSDLRTSEADCPPNGGLVPAGVAGLGGLTRDFGHAAMRPATTIHSFSRGSTAIGTGLRRRRLASWGWDYLVVLAWLTLVFVAIGVPQTVGWLDLGRIWSRPVAGDVAVTLLTVVPYLAYLTLTEAGPARATWGKRRVGLRLDGPGMPAMFAKTLVRNTVKVLPWQLGHMSAMRFAMSDAPTGFAALLFIASMVALSGVVLPVLLGRVGLHDRLAGTRVVPDGRLGDDAVVGQ